MSKRETAVDIVGIIKQTLNSVDPRLIDHGNRVGYLIYKVLQPQNIFNGKQMRDICILSMLHDVGAYKTEEIDKMVEFETIDVWDHSVYGYLFLKYFSPLNELAPVILYHHANCDEIKRLKDPQQQILAQLISLCDRADVFNIHGGSAAEFLVHLEENRDIKYRGDVVDMFLKAGVNTGTIFDEAGSDKAYNNIFRSVPLTVEEMDKYINTLIYSIDFRSNQTVIHTVYTVCISRFLADLLGISDKEELEKIRLGTILHDIGKVGIPVNILESTDSLDHDDMEIMKTHAMVTAKILEGNVPDEVIRIAANHHEKLNGTGYPNGLKNEEIHLYDRIVAISDITSALCRERTYKKAYPKEKTITILEDMSGRNLIDPRIVDLLVKNIDDILSEMEQAALPVMQSYMAVNSEYQRLSEEISRW